MFLIYKIQEFYHKIFNWSFEPCHLWISFILKFQFKIASKIIAPLPQVGQPLLKDWSKDLWFTISRCLPIASSEIEFIRHPILERRMNQPGVIKIHSWFTPQTADCKSPKMLIVNAMSDWGHDYFQYLGLPDPCPED